MKFIIQNLKNMAMPLRLLIFSLLISLTFSCKTQQSFTPETYQGKKLTFGSEGGFAGTTSEHYIFENGQVFRFKSRKGSTFELGKIDKDVVAQLFHNYNALGIDTYDLNDPGDLTYFIKMQDGNELKILKWGGMQEETPPIVLQYFKTLGQIVNKFKTVTE